MRISGLATGMDTEQIIKDMMKAHRIPLEKVTQKKQYTEWQLDDYRSVNRDLYARYNNLFDTIMKQSTFNVKKMNISNEDAVGIRALNATSEFSGTIAVKSLATQATLHGESFFNPDKKLIIGEKEVTAEEFSKAKFSELNLGTGTIKITAPNQKAVDIEITGDSTIDSVLKEINEKAGVSAFFDSGTGKIAMSAKNTGLGTISISGDADMLSKLKLSNTESKAGTDAVFTFNGLETTRSSNTFTINGFEINLKQPTTAPVTFSSAPDTDKVVESVVKFVDDYNKLIEDLNKKIREPKYRDFQPLSDEQKKDMKEKEIELWEEKAKSGTLRNDPSISNMLTSLRSVMSSSVQVGPDPNDKMSLHNLGISTSINFKDNGKLIIDETKLREAITEDPNKVYQLFNRKPTDDKNPIDGGIAVQYRKVVGDTRKSIEQKAGSGDVVNDTFVLGRSLKSMEKQIERFEDRLKMTEDRYWRQFTAMEKAIQRANAQSANMMNMFGGQ
ncbi:flagellar hook-associated protein 2 [Sporosarcina luteola]|uniref:flagellar hook-associated protein 2 n=1 Tax=Sporosarcina luteola TaxID=582850 RepID=UPI00203CB2DA|nr:flagellar hook-associated protein 2 [Sporosarcina luteola]MCM3711152.1 flagellar hook-associated protein 2 [Sporosarcina luteola]